MSALTVARLRILHHLAAGGQVAITADTRQMRHALVEAGLCRHVHLDDGVTEVGIELTDAGRVLIETHPLALPREDRP